MLSDVDVLIAENDELRNEVAKLEQRVVDECEYVQLLHEINDEFLDDIRAFMKCPTDKFLYDVLDRRLNN